jgi:putative hydroxymethylpyrimidine transporter CytX
MSTPPSQSTNSAGSAADPGWESSGPQDQANRSGSDHPGQRNEVPTTLTQTAPRTLGVLDQLGFWGNLGVSLLGFAGALSILTPFGVEPLGLPAAITAIVVGSVLGGLILGTSLVLGAKTGAPSMVLLRGLLGAKASFLPTVLNVAQCLGWAVFELLVIATGLQALTAGNLPRWVCVLIAGSITTALTIWPLGSIRVLRKYVSVLVVIAMAVLAIGLLRNPMPEIAGSWTGFWLAVDAAVALTISWVPLGADYSRHSRSSRAAFAGGFFGYGFTQIACLLLGVVALAQVQLDPDQIFDLFLAVPLGTVAFAVLVLRETDQSFANVYSTAVSIQNMRPRWDRRILTVTIGVFAIVAALTIDISQYTNFLYLIGAVFIPLSGALIAAWVRTRGIGWNISPDAPLRPWMLVAWAAGFISYQLVNPGSIPGWSDAWLTAGSWLHTIDHPWLSASITAFVVAFLIALPSATKTQPAEEPTGS